MRWLNALSKLCTAQLRPHPYWASMHPPLKKIWHLLKSLIEGCKHCESLERCKITVDLKRDIRSIIIVSYIPSILMNTINQASVYLRGWINFLCIMSADTVGLQKNATIWNNQHLFGKLYQSFTKLGLDPVLSGPPRTKKLHYAM